MVSVNRIVHLYFASLIASGRRLRYDFIREIVVAICSVVIFATFFYVFNDFLNVEVKSLSQGLRLLFAQVLTATVLILATLACTRFIFDELESDHSYVGLTRFLGEQPTLSSTILVLRLLTITVGCFGLAWILIVRYLIVPTLEQAAFFQLTALFAIAGFIRIIPRLHARRDISDPATKTTTLTMTNSPTRWRAQQLLFRSGLTRFCFLLSVLFATTTGIMAFQGAPYFALIFVTFISGVAAAAALAFQVSEDLSYAWIERCAGLSHEKVMTAYYRLGLFIAAASAGIIMVCCLPFVVSDSSNLLPWLKLGIIAGLSPAIMPLFLFQIDARRPFLQVTVLFLIGLFIATAIYAHILALGLLPFLKYYAENAQNGRFYRA